MVVVDATLISKSDRDAPTLTRTDVRMLRCVSMNGTNAVQMSVTEIGPVMSISPFTGWGGRTRTRQNKSQDQLSDRR